MVWFGLVWLGLVCHFFAFLLAEIAFEKREKAMKRRRRVIAAGAHSPPAPPESSLGLGRPFAQKKVTHFELKIFRLSPISIKATLDQMFVEIGVDMAAARQ